ncbi:hypothetical protein QFC21_000060 [Naganishia friedmannii]|uniref:Uncharacterized protein n=1 Tax=Naganishia friedmannii TaxID=89922 RepID=A0ACC2WBM3_9TREE|nr:hypothetical protein QFC21_000060 [Naganishia friedmannii]
MFFALNIARSAPRRAITLAATTTRPISSTATRAFPASDMENPGKPINVSENSQHPDQVKRGNEPANDAELDPKKSSEGGEAGSATFASPTKEPDASKKPLTQGSGTPGTNKLD